MRCREFSDKYKIILQSVYWHAICRSNYTAFEVVHKPRGHFFLGRGWVLECLRVCPGGEGGGVRGGHVIPTPQEMPSAVLFTQIQHISVRMFSEIAGVEAGFPRVHV